jgi:hypothetical protein
LRCAEPDFFPSGGTLCLKNAKKSVKKKGFSKVPASRDRMEDPRCTMREYTGTLNVSDLFLSGGTLVHF